MKKISIFIEKDNLKGEKKWVLYDGLLTNNKINISENKDLCDYIFIDFRDFSKAKKYKEEHLKKLVIIDFRDQPNEIFNLPCLKYFKRSVINKNNMEFVKYDRHVIPISYCIKNQVLEFNKIYNYDRDIDISIFFPPRKDSWRYRLSVAYFIKENFTDYNVFVGICGSAGEAGRSSIQTKYYEKMFRSKIVVTCNPNDWEGDYRTWEALSTGTLVFVDIMKTPVVNPLLNKKHVIFYDRNNLSNLKEEIIFYLKNEDQAKKISEEGCNYALKYHKPSDRIDEILNSL